MASSNNLSETANSAEKIRQAPLERFFGYYPGTVAVVSAAHQGERNLMSAGWHAALSMEPAMYGVSINFNHVTHALIRASQSFVINFLPYDQAELIAAVGSISKRDLAASEDKFSRFAIETDEALCIEAPIVRAAYLSYECRLHSITRVGDHDWFAGDVVAVHYDSHSYDERFMLDSAQTPAAIYYGRARYAALTAEAPERCFPPEAFHSR